MLFDLASAGQGVWGYYSWDPGILEHIYSYFRVKPTKILSFQFHSYFRFQCLRQFGVNSENKMVKIPGNTLIFKCFVLPKQRRV